MYCLILLSPSTFDTYRQQARDKNMGIAAIRERERLENERKKKQAEEDAFARKRQETNYRAWQARKEAEEKGESWPPPAPTPSPAERGEDNSLCGFICLLILLAIGGYFAYKYHSSCDIWGKFLGLCGLLWLVYPVALLLTCCMCSAFFS